MTTYGILSAYPPTRCALAAFTDDLRTELLADHAEEVRIVRVGNRSGDEAAEVVAWLSEGGTGTDQAVTALNGCDIGLIQHEYEIYGGRDGQDVLRVAEAVQVPTVAVLHTVLAEPRAHQREVLEELGDRVDAIAVTSPDDADRLLADYAVNPVKIAVIPHRNGPAGRTSGGSDTSDASDTAPAAYGRLAALLTAERAQLG